MNLTSRSFSNSSSTSSHPEDVRGHNTPNNPYYHPLSGMHMYPDSGLFGKDSSHPFGHHLRFPGVNANAGRTPFPFGLFSPSGMDSSHGPPSSVAPLLTNNKGSNKESGPGSVGNNSGGFSDSSNVEDKKEDTVVTCQSELHVKSAVFQTHLRLISFFCTASLPSSLFSSHVMISLNFMACLQRDLLDDFSSLHHQDEDENDDDESLRVFHSMSSSLLNVKENDRVFRSFPS